MRFISLNNNLDAITVGIIGSGEQGEEIKGKVLSMCSAPDKERVSFFVPRDGVSPETMISGAAKAGRSNLLGNAVWLACAVPEALPEDVSWPGDVIFVTDYISREHPAIAKLGFVPSFASIDELGILISGTLSREREAENTSLEIATLRAEKFRLNKRVESMEKAVRDAGDFADSVHSMWRAKTRVLKALFVLLFFISSLLFAWLVWGAYDPATVGRLLQVTHERTFGRGGGGEINQEARSEVSGSEKESPDSPSASESQGAEDESPIPGVGPVTPEEEDINKSEGPETQEEGSGPGIPTELGGPLPEDLVVPPPPAPIPVESVNPAGTKE